MESLAQSSVPEKYRRKLRDLFDALDSGRNGYLLYREVQVLGYAITGKVPTYGAAIREMERIQAECAAFMLHSEEAGGNLVHTPSEHRSETSNLGAARLSWPKFLLFGRALVDIPYPRFTQIIDTYIARVHRAEPRISAEDLRRLRRLHDAKRVVFPHQSRNSAPS